MAASIHIAIFGAGPGGYVATQVAGMIHAHPTLAEGMMEAMEDIGGSAIHQIRMRVD